jgi:predicted transcriptional regulator
LSVGAKISYAALLSYAWHNDCVFPGLETLAGDIGTSVRSVKTYVKELESFGVIEIKRRGLGKTNIYRLHFTVSPKGK